ncbi:hypothetical protein AB0K43_29525 [Kitasatospora sp. NPDC049258]|uniref:hypothetical protein n=1 Tax=Kitasatospora sp. NPDC049258 TaxID=3155394 RepID=UPI003436F252
MRTTSADPGSGPRSRARRVTLLALPCLACAVVSGVVVFEQRHHRGSDTATAGASAATAAVVRTDLADTQTLNGTLGYGGPQTVTGNRAGLVTGLPAAGGTVTQGQELYRVNDRPVPLFYGATPLFRPLDTAGLVGRDVKTVADNLKALGYTIGAQPAPGARVTQHPAAPDGPQAASRPSATTAATEPSATPGRTATAAASGRTAPAGAQTAPSPASTAIVAQVQPGDGVLTPTLIEAIKRWQTKAGLPVTGTLDVGDVAVLSGPVRIGAVLAHVGDPATAQLLTLTGTDKVVTVPVPATGVDAMKAGDPVSVVLPDNSTVAGTVAQVSSAVQGGSGSGGGGGGEAAGTGPMVNVAVSLDDASAVRQVDAAPVQARFTSQTRQGVLAVPVGALLAVSQGGYAVQQVDGRLLSVKTGLFAKGMVEISGAGITEGLRVVTAS